MRTPLTWDKIDALDRLLKKAEDGDEKAQAIVADMIEKAHASGDFDMPLMPTQTDAEIQAEACQMAEPFALR